jgi:hypothetical protein
VKDYEKQAEAFLIDSRTTIQFVRIGKIIGFPFDESDCYPHMKYLIVMKRENKTYDFPFYGSTNDYLSGKDPTAYDILACLETRPPEKDVWDFANEFGYDINSKKDYARVSKIRQACEDQYNSLLDLFGEKWMRKLEEIQ